MECKYDHEYIQAKTGVNSLIINGYFIHSKYDPIKEAEKLAEKLYVPHQAHIIFGYGCGYLVKALAEKREFDEIIIVVEPFITLDTIEVESLPSNTMVFGEDVLKDFEVFLSEFTVDYRTLYNVVCLSNYDKLFPEQYKQLLTKVKDVQTKNQVNDYTAIYFSKEWQKNFLENLFHLSNDYSLKELKDVYTAPVVVAAGGPSLSKQLPMIKKYRGQMILIAAGSTVNSLLKEGIEPDYVASIDGGIPNYNHFKGLALQQAKIVYTMQHHPGVREAFLSKGYGVDLKGHPLLSKFIQEQLNVELPLFEGGGTVAHLAFSIAQYISSGPIALVGQDLAYTNNSTHAAANRNGRIIDEVYLKMKHAFQTKSYDGGLVWTTPVFYSMKLDFEDLIKVQPPKNKFFNCTEGGLVLEGYEQIPFQTFCETYFDGNEVEALKEHPFEPAFHAFDMLKQQKKLYNKLNRMLDDAISSLLQDKSVVAFGAKLLKKLDQTDEKIQEILHQLPVESLLAPITMKVLRNYLPKIGETKEEEFKRVKSQSLDFYKNLKEALQLSKQYTEEVIQKYEHKEGQ